MLRFFPILLVFLFSINHTYSQSDCPCCTDNHAQFDFWVGDWEVFDTTGKKLGENKIQKLENNCILSETWKGSEGGSGRSYNYYNTADSTWNQVWIDSQGSNLVLKGKAETDKMILQSELLPGKKVDWYRNQITWTKEGDSSVTQLWEILDKDGALLMTAFQGIYKPK